ncbi:MAG: sigma-54-dependent Fis family transcriptional regulator [Gammaproteobacteria bacterium]|nr:sigma-54-dependent Fis family transcriptional regulator [Gammaproteobacteria bacterium]
MKPDSSDRVLSCQPLAVAAAPRLDMIKGSSNAIQKVRDQLLRFASNDASIFIYGETGTGKELVARALHGSSSRNGRAFIAVNCGAYPNDLILNELFGHERGAFTGAVARQEGLVSLAESGTLFLDEVDSLSLHAQVVLLRFLQDRRYRRLGGKQEMLADVRVIAASHCDLAERVADGRFREDLYYRLDVLRIELPPLRERREDILPLAQHFAERFKAEYRVAHPEMTAGFEKWMLNYHWPGNVRELENVMMRWLFGQLPASLTVLPDDPAGVTLNSLELDVLERIARSGAMQMKLTQAKAQVVQEFEKHYVASLLKMTQGNITQAARRAGKERRAFGRLVKKYNLA